MLDFEKYLIVAQLSTFELEDIRGSISPLNWMASGLLMHKSIGVRVRGFATGEITLDLARRNWEPCYMSFEIIIRSDWRPRKVVQGQ